MKKLIILLFVLINIVAKAQFQIGISNSIITTQYIIDNSNIVQSKIGLYVGLDRIGVVNSLDVYFIQDRYYCYNNEIMMGLSSYLGVIINLNSY